MCDAIQLIKDITTIIAGCCAIYIGFSGLNSWKKQLKGTAEYDLSKRIITGLYSYRDTIKHVRNPILHNHEREAPPAEKAKNMNQTEIDFYGYSKAYQNRWDKVDEAKQQFYTDRLEGEALWGDEFLNLFHSIPKLEHELFAAIQTDMVLRDPQSSKSKKDAWIKQSQKRRDVMYDTSDIESPDDYMSDLMT